MLVAKSRSSYTRTWDIDMAAPTSLTTLHVYLPEFSTSGSLKEKQIKKSEMNIQGAQNQTDDELKWLPCNIPYITKDYRVTLWYVAVPIIYMFFLRRNFNNLLQRTVKFYLHCTKTNSEPCSLMGQYIWMSLIMWRICLNTLIYVMRYLEHKYCWSVTITKR